MHGSTDESMDEEVDGWGRRQLAWHEPEWTPLAVCSHTIAKRGYRLVAMILHHQMTSRASSKVGERSLGIDLALVDGRA